MQDVVDEHGDAFHFDFMVYAQGEIKARIYGAQEKRNWVMWQLSKYSLALRECDDLSVTRHTNGVWENADDWRQLAH